MFVIIANSTSDRYILYFRAHSTYNLVCTAENEESILMKLEKFISNFSSKESLQRYFDNYQSYSTTYKRYTDYVDNIWNNRYYNTYSEKIKNILFRAFPAPSPRTATVKKGISPMKLLRKARAKK